MKLRRILPRSRIARTAISLAVLASLVAISVIVAGATGSTPADPVDMNDPDALLELVNRLDAGETLTDEEMEGVKKYVAIDHEEVTATEFDPSTSDGATADGPSCKGQTVAVLKKNIFGHTLWAFGSDTEWCYNGTLIQGDPSWETEGNSCCFWHYRGVLSESETGGDGETEHYDYAQAHFEQCIPTLGCTQSKYPTIRKWQYGDGTHTYQTTD